jgi:hypothetical protein
MTNRLKGRRERADAQRAEAQARALARAEAATLAGPRPQRPSDAAALREAAGRYALEALEVIASIMRDTKAVHATRLRAAFTLLSYAFGRPAKAPPPPPAPYSRGIDVPPPLTREEWMAAYGQGEEVVV